MTGQIQMALLPCTLVLEEKHAYQEKVVELWSCDRVPACYRISSMREMAATLLYRVVANVSFDNPSGL